jgi:type IV pilus assembly protein PilQ
MKSNKMFYLRTGLLFCLALLVLPLSYAKQSQSSQLTAVQFKSSSSNQVRVRLVFDKALEALPPSFTLGSPQRIVFDLNARSALSKGEMQKKMKQGVLQNFNVVMTKQRLRVILTLRDSAKYSAVLQGKWVDITLIGPSNSHQVGKAQTHQVPQSAPQQVVDVDFKATADKGGKLTVSLSNDSVPVDIQQQADSLRVKFSRTTLPEQFKEILDVSAFKTPVQSVTASTDNEDAEFLIQMRHEHQYSAYQVNKQFIIEFSTTHLAERSSIKQPIYVGKRISMHFQDIKVRAALQLLADTSQRNIVISDSVQGNVTLRLNQVPWDQALDIILKTRGLAKREYGKVIVVAPTREITEQEKQELISQQDVEKLAPLTQELLQINYARASDVANLLKDKNTSLLSKRGNVSVDERTNTLWIQDHQKNIAQARELIKKLDHPVQQVLIETRIVIVDRDFEKDLGVRFGVSRPKHFSGTLNGANATASNTPIEGVSVENRLNVDLPSAPANAASVGLALARLSNGTLLDLELSALETEGGGQIISTPRVITANQQEALIESGEEIPYQESTSSGATSIAFKKAVLSLRVKPQITPDDKIVLDLTVSQDTVGSRMVNNVPAIETKEIQTNVLVDNGETIVLGGIYKQTRQEIIERVPFLGKIPVLGALFSRKVAKDNRDELLIFVTPKIMRKKNTGQRI